MFFAGDEAYDDSITSGAAAETGDDLDMDDDLTDDEADEADDEAGA